MKVPPIAIAWLVLLTSAQLAVLRAIETKNWIGILTSSCIQIFRCIAVLVTLVWIAERNIFGSNRVFHLLVALLPVLHTAISTYYMHSVYKMEAAEALPKLVVLALRPICGAIFGRLPWCYLWPSRTAIMFLAPGSRTMLTFTS
jgi:hypothetical protein